MLIEKLTETITEVIKEKIMINNCFQEFKRYWCEIYSAQFKNAHSIEVKRAIKENVYKNINLTEEEKDRIWEQIMLLCTNE